MRHSNSAKTEIIYKTLGEVIRYERLKHNKLQRILADEFDIEKSLISRLENGVNEPQIVFLWSICVVLGITMHYLFKQVKEKLPADFF